MSESKPRRSIFDTLKKSADGRLGLAEAAYLADKISVFPVRHAEPAPVPTAAPDTPADDPTLDPRQDPTNDPTGGPVLEPDHLSAHPSSPLSGQPSRPLSGQLSRQGSGPRSDHDAPLAPTVLPRHDPTVDPAPTDDPSLDPIPDPTTGRLKASHDPDMKRIIRSLAENKRRFLHFIIDNEPAGDDYIISRQAVAKSLHLTEISVKRYFAEFADLGFFHKETYRRGVCQGLRLILARPRCQSFKRHDPRVDLMVAPSRDPDVDPTSRINVTATLAGDPTGDPTDAPTTYKEERKIENLSISSERIAVTWPHLRRAGFGREQLEQIAQALDELGKPADRVGQGLDHAEWELAHGVMRDKDGQPVLDPCSWVFRALARTGYYRRPKGYVSPEEQAARDAEEEARAVAAARRKAEQARFEAWRDGLSPEELAKAMRGSPGGPREAWLKAVWRKAGQ